MPERIELETLYLLIDSPVATCTFNRPDVRNAFNAQMIKDITWAAREIGSMHEVRVMVLTGSGSAFSAGADLNWMKSMKNFTYEQNLTDAEALADCMNALYHCKKPTIARVNGAVFGGGNGLVAACDIAVAAEEAVFAFTEVKLGIVPATIGPYVIRKIGEANARYLMLTGHRFSGREAMEYGLVTLAVPHTELNNEVDQMIEHLLSSGSEAMWLVKELCRTVPLMYEDEARTITAKMIADARPSKEGQEGISAFLEKRKPKWVQ